MAEKRLVQVGHSILGVLAVAVSLFSVRYGGVLAGLWVEIDPKIRMLIEAHPFEALSHILVAPIALLVGPWQFLPGLRSRRLPLHRGLGLLYVAACTVAGIGGLLTTFHATGGPVAGFGFALLAVLWTGTTLWAWRAVVAGDIPLHRLLMRFSFAMTFGAVTLRLQIPIGFALGFPNYSAMSVWLAYTSWIPNVIAVALFSAWKVSPGKVPIRSHA